MKGMFDEYPVPQTSVEPQSGSVRGMFDEYPVPGADQGTPTAAPAPQVAPMSPWARIPLGLGSAAIRGLATAAGTLGDIQGLEIGLINSLYGTNYPHSYTTFPTSAQTLAATNALGLTDRPSLAPQSAAERYAQAVISGIAAAAPMIALGQPPIGTLVGGASGALAGQGAADLGMPPAVQMGAGLLGGMAGQGVAQSFARGSKAIADSLGGSSTHQEAGIALQDSARDWLGSLKDSYLPNGTVVPGRISQIWAPVDSMIPRDTLVSTGNFLQTLKSITDAGGNLAEARKLLRPRLPDQLMERFFGPQGTAKVPPMARAPGVSGSPQGIINPPLRPGTPVSSGQFVNTPGVIGTGPTTWADMAGLRSDLGEALGNPGIVKDIGEENLSRLYRAVSEDMRGAAKGISPEAEQAFNSANSQTERLHQIAQGPMAKIVSGVKEDISQDPKAEDVAARLISGARRGGTDLAVLRQEIPDAVDELAAAHLRLNPDARAWTRLAPEAQAALIPSIRDRGILDALHAGPPEPSTSQKMLETLGGMGLGSAAGAITGHMLGSALGPYVDAAVGDLAGAAVPWAYRHARRAAMNPLALAPGVLGAEANPGASLTFANPLIGPNQ